MRPGRVDFYDPLYDFVTFEEAADHPRHRSLFDITFARHGADTHGESISPFNDTKAIIPFLSCVEFTRQNFLRQCNLAFLVYPSATHTRFAHSIGACYLGFIAAQRVAVCEGLKKSDSQTPIYLSKFLEIHGWREEFYLALLLHDVGHFPFSHALENNRELWDILGTTIHHEDVACQLARGQGQMFDASMRRACKMTSDSSSFIHLNDVFNARAEIDRNAICYLISGDDCYLEDMPDQKRAQLEVLHELVSGLLDLDRVDHYRRDNYFTGLRSGSSPNFASLLSGLMIAFDPKDSKSKPELRLSTGSVGHAISLLQTKERLSEDCFDHPDNIAYEAMLHNAFNLHVFGAAFYDRDDWSIDTAVKETICDLLSTTDDQLLHIFQSSLQENVRDISFRIVNRQPFALVTKLVMPLDHKESVRSIRALVERASGLKREAFSIRVTAKFGTNQPRMRTGEWLDLQRLRSGDGRLLVDGKYSRQIAHFKEAQENLRDSIWIFAKNETDGETISKCVSILCKELRCQSESSPWTE